MPPTHNPAESVCQAVVREAFGRRAKTIAAARFRSSAWCCFRDASCCRQKMNYVGPGVPYCTKHWLAFGEAMRSRPVGTPPRRSREERCG